MNDKINEMRDYGCPRKMLTSNKQTSHINTITYFSILSILCSVIKLVNRYCDFMIDLCNCFIAQSHIGFHGQPMSQYTDNKQYVYINYVFFTTLRQSTRSIPIIILTPQTLYYSRVQVVVLASIMVVAISTSNAQTVPLGANRYVINIWYLCHQTFMYYCTQLYIKHFYNRSSHLDGINAFISMLAVTLIIVEQLILIFLGVNLSSLDQLYRQVVSYISNTYFCFSPRSHEWRSSKNNEETVLYKFIECRDTEQRDNWRCLFPPEWGREWGRDEQSKGVKISPRVLVKSVIGQLPTSTRDWDEKCMSRYLDCMSLSHTFLPEIFDDQHNFLAAGAPILDFVAADGRRVDVWNVATTGRTTSLIKEIQHSRGLSWHLLESVEVREIVVGLTSQEETLETINWAKQKQIEDEMKCPLGVISLDVEEVQMSEDSYWKIINMTGSSIEISLRPRSGDKSKQFPCRIMLGNGMSWVLMILIEIHPVGQERAVAQKIIFQEGLLDYLQELPTAVGVNIRSDIMGVEDLVSDVTHSTFRMRGFYDLGALVALCGWNFKLYNMTVMATQIFGIVLNKLVSRGDGKWGMQWHRIPDALKVYCIGDIKFGYQTVVVMANLLLRDLFPDPDVVLSFMRLDGPTFGRRFGEWLIWTLKGVEIDSEKMQQASSRSQVIEAVRFRLASGKRSEMPPTRFLGVIELLGDWPSITWGGARYLHQARYHFIDQFEVMKESEFWREDIGWTICEEMMEAASYTVPNLHKVNWRKATQNLVGLGVHDAFSELVVNVKSGRDVTSEVVKKLAEAGDRIIREIVYEYCRLNIPQIPVFLSTMMKDNHYCKWPGSYCKEIRKLFMRVTGEPTIRVQNVEEQRQKYDVKLQAVRARIERTLEQLRQERELERFLELEREDDDYVVNNITWRGQVPVVVTPKLETKEGGKVKVSYVKQSRLQQPAIQFWLGEAERHGVKEIAAAKVRKYEVWKEKRALRRVAREQAVEMEGENADDIQLPQEENCRGESFWRGEKERRTLESVDKVMEVTRAREPDECVDQGRHVAPKSRAKKRGVFNRLGDVPIAEAGPSQDAVAKFLLSSDEDDDVNARRKKIRRDYDKDEPIYVHNSTNRRQRPS